MSNDLLMTTVRILRRLLPQIPSGPDSIADLDAAIAKAEAEAAMPMNPDGQPASAGSPQPVPAKAMRKKV